MTDSERVARAERPGFSFTQLGIVPRVLVALLLCVAIWIAIGVLL